MIAQLQTLELVALFFGGTMTFIAAMVGAAATIYVARISRRTEKRLETPGEGTIGQKVQAIAEDQKVAAVGPGPLSRAQR